MRISAQLISLMFIVLLAGCVANRFEKQDIEFYINEYNIMNVVFSSNSRLGKLAYELENIEGIDAEKYHSHDIEPMVVVLGEDQSGTPVILYVPQKTTYDIFILESPFPKYDIVVEEVGNHNDELTNDEISECGVINIYDSNVGEYKNNYRNLMSFTDQIYNNVFRRRVDPHSKFMINIGTFVIDIINKL